MAGELAQTKFEVIRMGKRALQAESRAEAEASLTVALFWRKAEHAEAARRLLANWLDFLDDSAGRIEGGSAGCREGGSLGRENTGSEIRDRRSALTGDGSLQEEAERKWGPLSHLSRSEPCKPSGR